LGRIRRVDLLILYGSLRQQSSRSAADDPTDARRPSSPEGPGGCWTHRGQRRATRGPRLVNPRVGARLVNPRVGAR